MPIIIKQYEWSQTSKEISIKLPSKAVSQKRIDIYCNSIYLIIHTIVNDSYLKVNYPPYFFELDLFKEIVEEESYCSIGNGYIHFRLIKKEEKEWEKLNKELEKEEMLERRKAAEMRHLEYQKNKKKELEKLENLKKEEELEKLLKQQQLERENLQQLKQKEYQESKEEIENWTKEVNIIELKENDKKEKPEIGIRQSGKVQIDFTNPNSQKPMRTKATTTTTTPNTTQAIAKQK